MSGALGDPGQHEAVDGAPGRLAVAKPCSFAVLIGLGRPAF